MDEAHRALLQNSPRKSSTSVDEKTQRNVSCSPRAAGPRCRWQIERLEAPHWQLLHDVRKKQNAFARIYTNLRTFYGGMTQQATTTTGTNADIACRTCLSSSPSQCTVPSHMKLVLRFFSKHERHFGSRRLPGYERPGATISNNGDVSS